MSPWRCGFSGRYSTCARCSGSMAGGEEVSAILLDPEIEALLKKRRTELLASDAAALTKVAPVSPPHAAREHVGTTVGVGSAAAAVAPAAAGPTLAAASGGSPRLTTRPPPRPAPAPAAGSGASRPVARSTVQNPPGFNANVAPATVPAQLGKGAAALTAVQAHLGKGLAALSVLQAQLGKGAALAAKAAAPASTLGMSPGVLPAGRGSVCLGGGAWATPTMVMAMAKPDYIEARKQFELQKQQQALAMKRGGPNFSTSSPVVMDEEQAKRFQEALKRRAL